MRYFIIFLKYKELEVVIMIPFCDFFLYETEIYYFSSFTSTFVNILSLKNNE